MRKALALTGVTACAQSFIDPVSVLLPYLPADPGRVAFTIRALDGPAQWRVVDPTVLKEPIQPAAASSELEIRPAIPEHAEDVKEHTWVLAESEKGVARSDVYVARVAKLSIETTAKAVAVGSLERIRVKAYDYEDNVFSTLAGLTFTWSYRSMKAASANPVLRIAKTQPGVVELQGLESGTAEVLVRLAEPGYEDLTAASVIVDVVEPFRAEPQEIMCPPNSELQLGVFVQNSTKTERTFQWQPIDSAEIFVSATGQVKIGTKDNTRHVLKVSDSRNGNNTDTVIVDVKRPQRLKIVYQRLPRVIDGAFEWSEETRRNLERLYSSQYHPTSVSASSPRSVLSRVGDTSASEWLLSADGIYIYTIVPQSGSRDLISPKNAKFALDSPESIDVLWTSSNGAVSCFRVLGEVGGSGSMTFRLDSIDADQYDLTSDVPFKILQPLKVADLGEETAVMLAPASQAIFASPVPLVLPLKSKVFLPVPGGGSDPVEVINADPSVCSLSVGGEAKLTSGNAYGSTLISVRSLTDPVRRFDFICVTAPIAELSIADVGVAIPLDGRDAVELAIIARPDLSKVSLSEDLKKTYSFFACPHLLEAVAAQSDDIATDLRLNVNTASQELEPRFEEGGAGCGLIILKQPRLPTISAVSVSLIRGVDGKPLYETQTIVEFYQPLAAELLDPVIAPTLDQSGGGVSGDTRDRSIAVIVGGRGHLALTGGPSIRANCRSLLALGSFDSKKLNVLSSSPDKQGSRKLTIECNGFAKTQSIELKYSVECTDGFKFEEVVRKDVACQWPGHLVILTKSEPSAELSLQDSSTIRVVAGRPADLVAVAYDGFGRPLIGTTAWQWSWQWAHGGGRLDSNTSELRLDASMRHDESSSKVLECTLRSTEQSSRTSRGLKNLFFDVGEKQVKSISARLEIKYRPPLQLDPKTYEGRLVHSPKLMYEVRVNSDQVQAALAPADGSLEIYGVQSQRQSLQQLQQFVRVERLISLHSDLDSCGRSSCSFIYLRPTGRRPGSVALEVYDQALIGAELLRLRLTTAAVAKVVLSLEDENGSIVPSDPAINVEEGKTYGVRLTAITEDGSAFGQPMLQELNISSESVPPALLDLGPANVTAQRLGSGYLETTVEGGTKVTQRVVVNEPLKIVPKGLVLMPGGSIWRPQVTGGGLMSADWQLRVPESQTLHSTRDDQTIITGNMPGGATVAVMSRHAGSGDQYLRRIGSIGVVVAYPARAVLRSSETEWKDQGTAEVLRDHRIAITGNLQTERGENFTPGATLVGGDYRCQFQWSTSQPEVALFDVKGELRKHVTGQLSVSAVGIAVGETNVTLHSECRKYTSLWHQGNLKTHATLSIAVKPPPPTTFTVGPKRTFTGLGSAVPQTGGLVLLAGQSYDITGGRLFCELSPSAVDVSRNIEGQAVCSSNHTVATLSDKILRTGVANAPSVSSIMFEQSFPNRSSGYAVLPVILDRLASYSVEDSLDFVQTDQVEVIRLNLLTPSGIRMPRPRDLRLKWLSSDAARAYVDQDMQGNPCLHVNCASEGIITVSVYGDQMYSTFVVRVMPSATSKLMAVDSSPSADARASNVYSAVKLAVSIGGLLVAVYVITCKSGLSSRKKLHRSVPVASPDQTHIPAAEHYFNYRAAAR